MYRRIQLIGQWRKEDCTVSDLIMSMAGRSTCEGNTAWAELNVRLKKVGRNCRFYFTEQGWARFGSEIVTACRQTGRQYRVLAVREREVDLVYQDDWQVIIKPRKRKANWLEP